MLERNVYVMLLQNRSSALSCRHLAALFKLDYSRLQRIPQDVAKPSLHESGSDYIVGSP